MNILSYFDVGFTTIAITSAGFGAVANILARLLLKDVKAKDMLAINFFIMGVILLLISPLFYSFQPSFYAISIILLIALIDTAANFFLFKTFEKTEATVATPILSLAPGCTFFFGWVLLGDIVDMRTIFLATAIVTLVIYFLFLKE